METVYNPLVSVITCFFNEEKFLEETINSVLSQSYTNWELILVDDGSVDESTLIAQKFARDNPGKVVYIDHEEHQNKGVCASRNRGVLVSKGELISLLDADDVWLEDKLRLQVDILGNHRDVGMLCEASKYWYSWADDSKDDVIIQVGCEQDKKYNPTELLTVLYPLANGAAPCPTGIIFRRDAFNKSGGFEEYFTGKYQLYEDQAFLTKMYLQENVFISSLCNNKYRQREGSCVQRVTHEGNYHVVREYFLEWFQKYLRVNKIRSTPVSKLLKKALEPYQNKSNPFLSVLIKVKKLIFNYFSGF
jgi:glycosyltransferase involved in cell wall biosynthesis